MKVEEAIDRLEGAWLGLRHVRAEVEEVARALKVREAEMLVNALAGALFAVWEFARHVLNRLDRLRQAGVEEV